MTNLRPPAQEGDEQLATTERVFTDEYYFFVQENFQVTDGIFADERVVCDKVTPEWQQVCTDELKFEVPAFEPFELEPVAQTVGE